VARPDVSALHAWRDAVLSEYGPTQPGARLVALAVAKFVNSRTLSCFASADAITKVTAMSERTVRTQLLQLLQEGWLSAAPLRRTSGWKLRQFTLQLPAGAAANFAGAIRDAAAKNVKCTGKKRHLHRQKLPTNSVLELVRELGRPDGGRALDGAPPPAPDSALQRERARLLKARPMTEKQIAERMGCSVEHVRELLRSESQGQTELQP
jgi:hypothetical protein